MALGEGLSCPAVDSSMALGEGLSCPAVDSSMALGEGLSYPAVDISMALGEGLSYSAVDITMALGDEYCNPTDVDTSYGQLVWTDLFYNLNNPRWESSIIR